MDNLFLLLFHYFRKRRIFFFGTVLVIMLIALWFASRISFEEDISKMISGLDNKNAIKQVIEQSKLLDKIIITLSLTDTNQQSDPEALIKQAEILADTLMSLTFQPYIKGLNFRFSASVMDEVFNIIFRNLPVFLEESDYHHIDTLTSPENLKRALGNSYNTLLSPASFAMKEMIVRDPVGLSGVALKKLSAFQNDDNYIIIEGCIFSKDKRQLLMFITTAFPSNATSKNGIFLRKLDGAIQLLEASNGYKTAVQYFGSAAVAAGNAERLKKDIRLTLSITLILLILIINFSIRKKQLFLFIFLPAIFGGLVALAVIYLIQAKISIISLSIGTVILAITVDYALHITTHYKHKHSVTETIKDVSFPIIVCGIATACEFISLLFVSSESLHELGILAAISVFTAAFFTMVVMPHILDLSKGKADVTEEKNYLERILDKITRYGFHKNKPLLYTMVVLSVVTFAYIDKVGFETDMMKMNYISEKLAKAEENLDKINNYKLNSIYVVAHGETLEKALLSNEKLLFLGNSMIQQGRIKNILSPGSLLFSDSLQRERIRRWYTYWSEEKRETFRHDFNRVATQTGFKTASFTAFLSMVDRSYTLMDSTDFNTLREHFYLDNLNIGTAMSTVVSVLKVDDESKAAVVKEAGLIEGITVMDRKSILSDMVNLLGRDFNLIANISLLLILAILIIAFGRFELGFITFLPILLSWVWTLGIMGMTGIKFNIFNIIISSFITGLGIDYSIYIMQGLVQGYKTNNTNLLSYKTCILISVMISISGTGVLILAKHPSLNSIALISIIGLLSVVIISYTFEPVLFYWLVNKKGKNRALPLTLSDIMVTLTGLTMGLAGCIFMNLMLFIVFPLPIPTGRKKQLLHLMLVWSLKIPMAMMFNIRKTILNEGHENFNTPSVIIANHQSHLDLPLLLMLSPKIIVLTTRWVWNNPVYALVIRFLDFYPVMEGHEMVIDKLKKKVEEGYSILVFPEGTRSPDASIKRFHKGAFLLAEKLNLDLTPVIIHGAVDCMNKGENHIKGGKITVKIFPRIRAGDLHFGRDYHERTKATLKFFREKYRKMKTELENPAYFRKKLIRNYIYKGPLLEWYTRIKLSLERNYALFHSLVPANAEIVDIGCGYGMMSYMLGFTSDKRNILGIDYDLDKIELANNCISKSDRIRFVAADANTFPMEPADVFILSDMLHYIPEAKQVQLVVRCIENLKPGGIIIIRDADKDMHRRHVGTRYTEFFSTRLGFNKTYKNQLYFFSGSKIREIADRKNMKIEIMDNSWLTSNLVYILRNS